MDHGTCQQTVLCSSRQYSALAVLWSSATGNQSWISQTQHGLETDTRQIDIGTQSNIRRHTSSLPLIATLAILKHMLSSSCFLQIAFYPWNQIQICFMNKSRLVCSSPSASPPPSPLAGIKFSRQLIPRCCFKCGIPTASGISSLQTATMLFLHNSTSCAPIGAKWWAKGPSISKTQFHSLKSVPWHSA